MILCSDPHAQYLANKDAIDSALHRVLESGRYLKGEETEAFETEFASYLNVGHCLGVGNGTDALEIALTACDVGTGDEVITVSHTATATVSAIHKTGATPIFADITAKNYVMDPAGLKQLITEKTRAIVPVHLYGHPAPMPEIMRLAKENNLTVIEDCAQSHGACIDGKYTGSFGDLACFSFYPTKNLSALGDAGAVVTNSQDLFDKCRHLSQYGWEERFISVSHGWNSRMDELQAAVLRVKLTNLEATTSARITLAGQYCEALSEYAVQLPSVKKDYRHVFHLFVIQSDRRNALLEYLNNNGIGAAIHYPVPVHQQPAYASPVKLPVTEQCKKDILSLPMYPELGDQIFEVIEKVKEFFNHAS